MPDTPHITLELIGGSEDGVRYESPIACGYYWQADYDPRQRHASCQITPALAASAKPRLELRIAPHDLVTSRSMSSPARTTDFLSVENSQHLDELFREAVSAIDAGDIAALEQFLVAHPNLVHERLESPGSWLRDQVGGALDTFFKRPCLLWFVAEDPIRNGKLPSNIATVAQSIIRAAQREAVTNLQKQLDYALKLVAWSTIAPKCGVQINLIDTLVDAGANPHGNPDNALVNGNFAAAERLVERGATLTLATALCLGRWDEAAQLAPAATDRQKRFALVLAALNGQADAMRRMIALDVDVNAPSEDLHSHGTPLHHAVCSGSLDAVRALVEAGADLNAKDTAWHGTPLGWAEHCAGDAATNERGKMLREIAAYLSALKTP